MSARPSVVIYLSVDTVDKGMREEVGEKSGQVGLNKCDAFCSHWHEHVDYECRCALVAREVSAAAAAREQNECSTGPET